MKLILIILIILIIRIIYVIYNVYKNYMLSKICQKQLIINKILLKDIKYNLQTGDLILFNYNHAEIWTRIFGNTMYSHIGIIIKIDNEFYIYEIIKDDYKYKGKKYQNVQLSNLDDRINNYVGNVYIGLLKNKLSDEQLNLVYKYIDNHKNIKFGNILSFFINIVLGININNTYFCNELISNLLDNINLSTKKLTTKPYLISTNIINLLGDTHYDPLHIIPDKLLVSNNNILSNKNINMC